MSESSIERHPKYQPTVSELMSTDLFTLFGDDNLDTLDELMRWRRIRHVPVVNLDGQLAGLITHRDFLSVAISRLSELDAGEIKRVYRGIPISEIMRTDVVTISPDTPLEVAARLLYENKLGCLPVVGDDSKLVGIITEADFVRAFVQWDARFTKD